MTLRKIRAEEHLVLCGALWFGRLLRRRETGLAQVWRRLEPVPLGAPERPKNLLSFLGSTASQPARSYLPAHIIDDIAVAAYTA